jgi:hypothetical protein
MCEKCDCIFCSDCDMFIHDTLHSCPGCASSRSMQESAPTVDFITWHFFKLELYFHRLSVFHSFYEVILAIIQGQILCNMKPPRCSGSGLWLAVRRSPHPGVDSLRTEVFLEKFNLFRKWLNRKKLYHQEVLFKSFPMNGHVSRFRRSVLRVRDT